MSTQVVEISDGRIVVTTDVGLNGATKQALADEATARANADIALTAAIALKAPLASPALTGTPTAPTAATATSTTQLATTAFVQQELAAGGSTARALVVSVRNQSGATMAAGTVVYLNGATGNLPTIAKALATSDATSAQTIGLVQTSIANNGTGLVVVRGVLGNLNTSTLAEEQQLYLSPTTAGAYTTTKQYAPNHLVYIGVVTHAHPTLGSIEVAVQNGFELDELHNVSAQSPTNGDVLRYNSATGLWEKSALGTLATQSGTFSGTSSGTNTGDQTITLTGDVTGTGTGSFAATIAANAVTNAKAAQIATQTFKGRNTAATGNVEDLSVATVKTMLAISNVDNTSDANKPVSTAQQTALDLKANLASPVLTGTPTAPTAAALTNSTQLSTTAYADAADIASKAALIEREGLRFDGTAGAVIGGGGIPAVGTGDFTVSFILNPGTTLGDLISGSTNSLNAYYVGGVLGIQKTYVALGGFTARTINSPTHAAYVRQSGVGQWYVAGATSGSPQADTNNYSVVSNYLMQRGDGTQKSSGSLASTRFFNYALTQAEITALIGRGLVTLPEQRGGSMTALNTGSLIATEVPTSGFLSTSSTAATRNSTADSYWSGYALGLTFKVGQQFRVSMTVTNWQTSSENGVRLGAGIGDPSLSNIYQVTANGAVSFVLTATSNTATHLNFKRVKFDYSGLSIIPLGTLFEQDSGQRNAGYMVRDTSGNNCDLILPATGVSVIDPAQRGTIRFTTATSGNQQIGGSQVIIPTNARISSWVINSSGTPNVTLGNASAGAQYRASAAVVSGDNQITLLTPFTSTGNLWVNSSTTATLKHTIQWEYIQ